MCRNWITIASYVVGTTSDFWSMYVYVLFCSILVLHLFTNYAAVLPQAK